MHSKEKELISHKKLSYIILNEYQEWLNSADSGVKTNTTKELKLSILKKFFDNPESSSIEKLVDPICLNKVIKNNLVEKKWAYGSVSTNLYNLQTFFIFMSSPFFRTVKNQIIREDWEQVEKMALSTKESLGRWARSYGDQKKVNIDEKLKIDEDNIFDKKERIKMRRGVLFNKVKNIIESDKKPNVEDATIIRNYLISNLCIRNAQRAGVIHNLKETKFIKSEKRGIFNIINIQEHKTI